MKKIVILSMLVVLGLAAMVVLADYPVSTQGVVPVFVNDGPGGNVECGQVGDYAFVSDRFDNGDQYEGTFELISWSTDASGKFVSWNGEHGGMAVIVKGGPGAHVYVYGLDPYFNWDSELASPLVGGGPGGGNIPGLSNITFCWNPPDEEEGQWCSPGYWRQPHHLDSWEATGISPDEKYSDYFGTPPRSPQGVRQNATTDPTLWQVLQSPQWYGGDAFNNVGDLLSAAHPDVNFTGERVEDSCPLN